MAPIRVLPTVDATSLQIPGVLDDLFYFGGELGARPSDEAVQFRLWAPTAQSVRLLIGLHAFLFDWIGPTKQIISELVFPRNLWQRPEQRFRPFERIFQENAG